MDAARQVLGKGRIRGPKLAVFIKHREGVPMEEALRRADDAGVVIASNKTLSKALLASDEWQGLRDAFMCWSGTMTAYEKRGQELGKSIEYTDPRTGIRYIFQVPEEHVGKKDVILVTEHPDFRIEAEGMDRIVLAATVDAVERFPTHNGDYHSDPKYGIPYGDFALNSNPDDGFLWRTNKRVGLIARDLYGINGGRCVVLDWGPSYGNGVAVEEK